LKSIDVLNNLEHSYSVAEMRKKRKGENREDLSILNLKKGWFRKWQKSKQILVKR
jgi:hypothetical protein